MKSMITAVFLAVAAASAAHGGDAAERMRELCAQAPEDFRKRPEAAEEIDFQKIDYALLDAAVFHETNRRRDEEKLPPLAFKPELREAALVQARAMVKLQKVTHRNPAAGEAAPSDRIKRQGLDGHYYAENVAMVFGIRYKAGEPVIPDEENGGKVFRRKPGGPVIPPHTYLSFANHLLDEWMGSPGHRRNILAEEPGFLGTACLHSRDDIGMDVFYCAQEFYAPFAE